MTKAEKKRLLEARIALLESRGENGPICAKIRRQLRKLEK